MLPAAFHLPKAYFSPSPSPCWPSSCCLHQPQLPLPAACLDSLRTQIPLVPDGHLPPLRLSLHLYIMSTEGEWDPRPLVAPTQPWCRTRPLGHSVQTHSGMYMGSGASRIRVQIWTLPSSMTRGKCQRPLCLCFLLCNTGLGSPVRVCELCASPGLPLLFNCLVGFSLLVRTPPAPLGPRGRGPELTSLFLQKLSLPWAAGDSRNRGLEVMTWETRGWGSCLSWVHSSQPRPPQTWLLCWGWDLPGRKQPLRLS